MLGCLLSYFHLTLCKINQTEVCFWDIPDVARKWHWTLASYAQSVWKAVRDFLPELRLAFRVRCTRAGLGRPRLSAGVRSCLLCQWDSLECGHAHSWDLSSGYRDPHGPRSRKYLLSSHLQKRFDDPALGHLLSAALPQWDCPVGPLFWADETLALAVPQGMRVRGWDPLPTGNSPSAASTTWAGCGAQLAISAVVSRPLPGRPSQAGPLLFLGRPGSGSGAPRVVGGEQERKKRKEREIKQINTLPSKCGFTLNFQNT